MIIHSPDGDFQWATLLMFEKGRIQFYMFHGQGNPSDFLVLAARTFVEHAKLKGFSDEAIKRCVTRLPEGAPDR